MTVYCANCRQAYSPRPIVDLTGNVLIWGNQGCSLGHREAEIMHVLLDRPNGAFVEKGEIAERVFGIIGVADERSQIDQHVFNLRKKVERLGITIETQKWFAIAVHYATPPPPSMRELMENTSEESKRTEQAV